MGVKDLWQILSPICERKSLWDLQGKTLAVDLSAWICDSQNVGEHSSQPRMYLRNLFFRTSCLLLLGARPIFVLDGIAPDLKLNCLTQRQAASGAFQSSQASKSQPVSGSRRRLKGIQNQCLEMLKSMGVHCVQSAGEAEALCALLNANGIVDGCITQDSDCFLYGAKVVYRNFTITSSAGGGPGFSVDMYDMRNIEDKLGLSRQKLVALSLLCGCDYKQGGVAGVGKELALKFLSTLQDDEIFSRLQKWKNDPLYARLEEERVYGVCDECGHLGKKKEHNKNGCDDCGTAKGCRWNSVGDRHNLDPESKKLLTNELNIRKKALQDPDFPSQDIIDEFLNNGENLPSSVPSHWTQPDFIKFMKLAAKLLAWEETYSLEKFLPLLTRWVLLHKTEKEIKCPLYPEAILKTRTLKGTPSYEIKWNDDAGLFQTLCPNEQSETSSSNICVTIEPKDLVEKAFPDLVEGFIDEQNKKKQAKKKGKTKSVRSKKEYTCSSCGKAKSTKNQKCMCEYLKPASNDSKKMADKSKSVEDELENWLQRIIKSSSNYSEEAQSQAGLKVENQISSTSKSRKSDRYCNVDSTTPLESLLDNLELSDLDQPEFEHYNEKEENKNYDRSSENSSAPMFEIKPSYEDLLIEEEWESDGEMDLSTIVESIVQNGAAKHMPPSESSPKSALPCRRIRLQSEIPDPSKRLEYPKSKMDVENVTPVKKNSDDSFDESTPYTPLLERIKRERNSSLTSPDGNLPKKQARRFSKSFLEFGAECRGKSSIGLKEEIFENSVDVNFSLGCSDLLNDSF